MTTPRKSWTASSNSPNKQDDLSDEIDWASPEQLQLITQEMESALTGVWKSHIKTVCLFVLLSSAHFPFITWHNGNDFKVVDRKKTEHALQYFFKKYGTGIKIFIELIEVVD